MLFRGQLGGVEGAKVKIPTPCDSLSTLRPTQLVGGEQTLFAVTSDGKVFATGEAFLEDGKLLSVNVFMYRIRRIS